MKIKQLSVLLAFASVFAFSSCGDSKDKVVDDLVVLIDGLPSGAESVDKDIRKKYNEEMEEIVKRGEVLGLDATNVDGLTPEQAKKIEDAHKRLLDRTKAELDKQMSKLVPR